MTGGVGVVVGKCGHCVGSGMTGGELFVYDSDGSGRNCLSGDVNASGLTLPEKETLLMGILKNFHSETNDTQTGAILDNWENEKANFIHVRPGKLI